MGSFGFEHWPWPLFAVSYSRLMRAHSSVADPVRFGQYNLVGRIGEGGMCHVFRARKQDDPVEYAIKLLKEDQRNQDRVLDLFITEADLSLMLNHPNLIKTIEAGEIKGRYFIAMELIEGVNLQDLVLQIENIGVRMPPDFALFIVHEVLQGLGALHGFTGVSGRELDLIHRDVTPSNIFICFDGRVILGDFGVAHIKAYGGADSSVALGKLGYLSPEVTVGDEIDHRSDLFAVGVILWELLTGGRLYFGAEEKAVLQSISEAHAPPIRNVRPGLSPELEKLVTKALSRKPQGRFQTTRAMTEALRPMWTTQIGSNSALSALLAGLFRDEYHQWATERGTGDLPTFL
jgi:eukaryotic-like serine/threonine-protein kinase